MITTCRTLWIPVRAACRAAERVCTWPAGVEPLAEPGVRTTAKAANPASASTATTRAAPMPSTQDPDPVRRAAQAAYVFVRAAVSWTLDDGAWLSTVILTPTPNQARDPAATCQRSRVGSSRSWDGLAGFPVCGESD